MAASYTYDERATLIRATAGPELTFAEYLALRQSVEGDPRIPRVPRCCSTCAT